MKRDNIYNSMFILLIVITFIFYMINHDASSSNLAVSIEQANSMQASSNVKLEQTASGINYDVNLNKPGDTAYINLSLSNDALFDTVIDHITYPIFTYSQSKYLDYKVLYEDGREVRVGDVLKANSSNPIKIVIHFKEDIEASDLPDHDEKLDLSLDISVVRRD